MKQHVILIEKRKPRTKEETGVYGQTLHDRDFSKVFINCTKDRWDNVDTFFHELTHVYLTWMGYRPGKLEETICDQVAEAATKALKRKGR